MLTIVPAPARRSSGMAACATQERSLCIDVHDAFPLSLAHVFYPLHADHARRVNRDIEPPEPLHDRVVQALRVIELGDIQRQPVTFDAEADHLFSHPAGRGSVDIGNQHVGSFAGKAQSDTPADATSASSHIGDFPSKFHGTYAPLWSAFAK